MSSVTLDQLKQDWPGWNVWRTETMWNATRRGPKLDIPAGFSSCRGYLAPTLVEDGPLELTAALHEQAAIEEELKAFLADGHGPGHSVTPACPLACLGLTQATEDALVMRWRADGQYAPVIRDLLRLHTANSLTSVPGIGYGRYGEIRRRIKALNLEVSA